MIFRTQLPNQMVTSVLPELVRHLEATRPVVHNYAAFTIEKTLLLKAEDGTAL
jgi:hypothetical protein